MKILCTSDWHLGKKTDGKSRLDEQRIVLACIFEIVTERAVDMVIVAGDVFDTAVPSAEAEALFYEYAYKIGRLCPVVVLAGNHDDADRLCASSHLAKECGVFLFGSESMAFCREGLTVSEEGVVYQKDGDVVSIAVLSYPSESALSLADGASYSDAVAQKIQEKCRIFSNGTNIFASHLFMLGSENDLCDERELGSAKLLPTSVLPDCDLVLLGHVHKPMTVSKSKNAYYSGSIIPYSFDDTTQKRVMIFDTRTKQVESVQVSGYKKCVRIKASSLAEIMQALHESEDWVEIRYEGSEILPPSAHAQMRKEENFVNIVLPSAVSATLARRKEATTKELFEEFYKKKKGAKPSDEIVRTFLSYMEKAGENRE